MAQYSTKANFSIRKDVWERFKNFCEKHDMKKSPLIETMMLKILQDLEPKEVEMFDVICYAQPLTDYEPSQILNRLNKYLYQPHLAIQSIFGRSKWVALKVSPKTVYIKFTYPYDYSIALASGQKSREKIKEKLSKVAETTIEKNDTSYTVLKKLFEAAKVYVSREAGPTEEDIKRFENLIEDHNYVNN